MTGKPEEHQVPKPVADMFRVLQQGTVDERREANLLGEVKARLLAEGHPTVQNTQPATEDDTSPPPRRKLVFHQRSADREKSFRTVNGRHVKVTNRARGVESMMWTTENGQIAKRGLGVLLQLAWLAAVIVSFVVWDNDFPFSLIHMSLGLLLVSWEIRQRARRDLDQMPAATVEDHDTGSGRGGSVNGRGLPTVKGAGNTVKGTGSRDGDGDGGVDDHDRR